jgi:hypothetical protein
MKGSYYVKADAAGPESVWLRWLRSTRLGLIAGELGFDGWVKQRQGRRASTQPQLAVRETNQLHQLRSECAVEILFAHAQAQHRAIEQEWSGP